MRNKILMKPLYKDTIIPTCAHTKDAGWDLYFHDTVGDIKYAGYKHEIDGKPEYLEIRAHQTIMCGTGIAITPPEGYFGAIFARSGLATKQGLRPENCVGVCDEGYKGEYIIALHNDTESTQRIYIGDRIAQVVFIPYGIMENKIVDELPDIDSRGTSGFGESGK